MAILGKLNGGLRALFHRRQVEQELDEELRGYLDAAVEQKIATGMSRGEALRAARIEMGSLATVKDNVCDIGWESFVGTFWQDIRYAVRVLRKNPGFTTVAVLTLALGIGANTAIFSLIDAVMLRSLPVQHPEELVQLQIQDSRSGTQPGDSFTNPLWEQVRDHQDVLAGAFAWSHDQFDLAQGGTVRYAEGVLASGGYFSTLGVRPAAGRLLVPADDQRGCPPVVVLSYGFWQNLFGGAPSAVGSTLSLNHRPFQVIGVSAPGFSGVDVGYRSDVTIPICAAALFDGKPSRLDHRSWWWLNVIGRRKPGDNPAAVEARLAVLSPAIFGDAAPLDRTPENHRAFLRQKLVTAPAAGGSPYLRQRFRKPLTVLMGVVGIVLLIACANIASLMLARAANRSREIAVRKALGASRPRLIRQLLTECVLLSGAGALLGLLFARSGSALLVRYVSTRSSPLFLDIALHARVLAFTALIAVPTGMLLGLLPALRCTRVSLMAAMKGSQAPDGAHAQRSRASHWAVASQLALSLVLLVGAGLLLRSFAKLVTLDLGFDTSNVLLVNANLQAVQIPPAQRSATYGAIEPRLRALPGVISASRSVLAPISGTSWTDRLEADSPNAPREDQAVAFVNYVDEGYFATMRTRLLAGRQFDASDTATSARVAIVNQRFAQKFFLGINAIGKTFRSSTASGKAPSIEIVGVVENSRDVSPREDAEPSVFFPLMQLSDASMAQTYPQSYELRTLGPPMALACAVEEAVAAVNKGAPLEFHTLAERVDDTLVQERLLAMLSAFFGGLALLLACIGLYGALSYLVSQRQAEFGIRLALGAPPRSILRLVMRDFLAILAGGVAAGIGISLATVSVLQSMLFGLEARDADTLVGATLFLAAVALVACYLPARRATKVDPMSALRYE